ncbi:murein biosynthesis integral membrane protein MurJ, partial [Shewanella sp. 0m-11]
AKPMLMVLFMRGAFSYEDVEMASYSLMAYGSGLLSFMLIKILAPGYYSRQDTKTPVRYGIIAMVSNMVFNLIFAIPFGYVGLAIATSMSALLNAGLLYRGLHKANVYRVNKATLVFLAKSVLAAGVMLLVLFQFDPTTAQWLDLSFIERSYTLVKLIVFAAVAYFICLVCLGIRPWKMKAAV